MLHLDVDLLQPATTTGLPKIDAMARRRTVENPATRDCTFCQSCGRRAGPECLCRVTWSYYFTPNRVIAVLAPIAAATGAAIVKYTREVRHETFHVLCPDCLRAARRERFGGHVLRFIGLFLAILGFGLSAAAAAWWPIAEAPDRALIRTWVAVPVGGWLLGMWLAYIGRRMEVPAALRPLAHRPFHAHALKLVGRPATAAGGNR